LSNWYFIGLIMRIRHCQHLVCFTRNRLVI